MSKTIFTKEQIEDLKNNKFVQSVSSKGITYTMEFKHLAVEDFLSGMSSTEVFSKYGFDVNVLGKQRPSSALSRWKKQYQNHGLLGLKDSREQNPGRPLERDLSTQEKMERYEAKIKYLEAEVELLKKFDAIERMVVKNSRNKSTIYQLIESTILDNDMRYKVKYLCELAQVSRSGYYSYLKSKHGKSAKESKDEQILAYVKRAMKFKGYEKGSRQITMRINRMYKSDGVEKRINRKCVQRIMKKYGVVCPIRKPNPYLKMAKATKEHRTVGNILNREFKPGVAGKVLLTDVTYIHYHGHKKVAYLSTIKDSQTNEILSYRLSNSLRIDFVLETVKELTKYDHITSESIIHSDQGVHYTSPKFQNLAKSQNLNLSMSRRGNCWDNAPQESFFGHMKQEIKSAIDIEDIYDYTELEREIAEYIDYYNNDRPQWNLKKLTPVEYRNQLIIPN